MTRRDCQTVIACALTLVLLVGSLPLMVGVTVQNSQPAFTLDICHPLQVLDQSPVITVMAAGGSGLTQPQLPASGRPIEFVLRAQPGWVAPPDPPPPKTLS